MRSVTFTRIVRQVDTITFEIPDHIKTEESLLDWLDKKESSTGHEWDDLYDDMWVIVGDAGAGGGPDIKQEMVIDWQDPGETKAVLPE